MSTKPDQAQQADAGGGTVAAAAWHAEPIVQFLCAVLGVPIADVRVSEDEFIVVTAELRGDNPIEASIAVGPDGTCAGKIAAGDTHLASTAPDVRSFEQALKNRLAEVGVYRRESASND